MIYAVDASAICAVIFEEPSAEEVVDRLRSQTLIAPPLIRLEVANVCLVKMRRGRSDRETMLGAYDVFRRLPINLMEVDGQETLSLAEETGLTAYDAAYLRLSEREEAELLTLDAERAGAYLRRRSK